jgi:hypothetical protein
MAERKLMTKYIPKDYDPANMPKVSMLPRGADERIRLMLPMACQCNKCKTMLFPGKKFNGTKRTTKEKYAGKITIFTLTFRCTGCSSEITFKTDPKNRGYELVSGATRFADNYTVGNAGKKAEAALKDGIVEFKSNVELIEERAYASHRLVTELESLEEEYEERCRLRQMDVSGMAMDYIAAKKAQESGADAAKASAAEQNLLDEDEFAKLRRQMEQDNNKVDENELDDEDAITSGYWDELIASDSDEDAEDVETASTPAQSASIPPPTTTTTPSNLVPLAPAAQAPNNIFVQMNKTANQFGLTKKRALPPQTSQADQQQQQSGETSDAVKKACAGTAADNGDLNQLVQLSSSPPATVAITSSIPTVHLSPAAPASSLFSHPFTFLFLPPLLQSLPPSPPTSHLNIAFDSSPTHLRLAPALFRLVFDIYMTTTTRTVRLYPVHSQEQSSRPSPFFGPPLYSFSLMSVHPAHSIIIGSRAPNPSMLVWWEKGVGSERG